VRYLNFRRLEQPANPFHGCTKFLRIVRADYALARCQPQRFYDARELDAGKNALQPLVETKGKKSRHWDTGIAQDFALPQFASAMLDGVGMIVSQTKSPRSIRGRRSGPVTEGDQSIHRPHE